MAATSTIPDLEIFQEILSVEDLRGIWVQNRQVWANGPNKKLCRYDSRSVEPEIF